MDKAVVRLDSVEIRNFKNVKHGTIRFDTAKKDYDVRILGLYGQNGSGKTALIDVLSFLHEAVSGVVVSEETADYINVDADFATLKYGFSITDVSRNVESYVFYEVSIRKDVNEIPLDPSKSGYDKDKRFKVTLFDEVLSYSCECGNGRTRMQPVIDTRKCRVFGPKSKLKILVSDDQEIYRDLEVKKILANRESRSFIFSRELRDVINSKCKDVNHLFVLQNLFIFASLKLFVIRTRDTAKISLNMLPFSTVYKKGPVEGVIHCNIPLNSSVLIPEPVFEYVENSVFNMNIVLKEIVPGLKVDIKNLGPELFKNGSRAIKIQLVSFKNEKEIPLRYESEGIKKIISVLCLLIQIYNNPSVCVAIDELDSGIFEYLLGELLRIIALHGKGQLVFTSHNLRPLETLDKCFVAFTTINPENRYIRLAKIKPNNNLRDFYYRDILLGGQTEETYNLTNNSRIAFAFLKAGKSVCLEEK